MSHITHVLALSCCCIAALLFMTGCEDSDDKLELNFSNMVEEVVIPQGATIKALEANTDSLPELELTLNGETIPFDQDDMRFTLIGSAIESSKISIEVISGDDEIVDTKMFRIEGPVENAAGEDVYGIVVNEYTFNDVGTARIRITGENAFVIARAEFDLEVVEGSDDSVIVESVTNSF